MQGELVTQTVLKRSRVSHALDWEGTDVHIQRLKLDMFPRLCESPLRLDDIGPCSSCGLEQRAFGFVSHLTLHGHPLGEQGMCKRSPGREQDIEPAGLAANMKEPRKPCCRPSWASVLSVNVGTVRHSAPTKAAGATSTRRRKPLPYLQAGRWRRRAARGSDVTPGP